VTGLAFFDQLRHLRLKFRCAYDVFTDADLFVVPSHLRRLNLHDDAFYLQVDLLDLGLKFDGPLAFLHWSPVPTARAHCIKGEKRFHHGDKGRFLVSGFSKILLTREARG
jgi:hypothetical protein